MYKNRLMTSCTVKMYYVENTSLIIWENFDPIVINKLNGIKRLENGNIQATSLTNSTAQPTEIALPKHPKSSENIYFGTYQV